MLNKINITAWFKGLQTDICDQLAKADGSGKSFRSDLWERPGGGGGLSRTFDGDIIEKGGVGFSEVHGQLSEGAQKNLGVSHGEFFATGVSIVLHPRNPFVPIIHMNVRYFELGDGTWWFGGGIDLTPHYIVDADAAKFHKVLKAVCDRHDIGDYNHFKKWADDYFYIKHRSETRGVGGIFFDRLKGDKTSTFEFVKDVGSAFAPIYIDLMERCHDKGYDESHLQWQALRRSRYVEFNLVWDRGTQFGLQTNGRTESILMSMPPMARWVYNYQPTEGSAEEITLSKLKKEIDWVRMG